MFSWENKKKYQCISVDRSDLFKAVLSNLFVFIDHKSRIIKIDSFEFHFFITAYKNKKCEKHVSKNRLFRLVDYKKSSDYQSQETKVTDDYNRS